MRIERRDKGEEKSRKDSLESNTDVEAKGVRPGETVEDTEGEIQYCREAAGEIERKRQKEQGRGRDSELVKDTGKER